MHVSADSVSMLAVTVITDVISALSPKFAETIYTLEMNSNVHL